MTNELEGVRRPRTIDNYVSAMRQYVAMVHELGFLPNENLSIANELVEMTAPAIGPKPQAFGQ
ncbi:hypothetical protein TUM4637_17780 [Shewanella hafniensis]|nr:hypothetical protein TUM4637_17780 [Shewanella hafniensis]